MVRERKKRRGERRDSKAGRGGDGGFMSESEPVD
jgi:hypothetical protein